MASRAKTLEQQPPKMKSTVLTGPRERLIALLGGDERPGRYLSYHVVDAKMLHPRIVDV